MAFDSKLRGCDVVALKIEDIAPNGYSVDRATIRQKKTDQPVRFELTEQTRQALDNYLRAAGKTLTKDSETVVPPSQFLFTGARVPKRRDDQAVRKTCLRVGCGHQRGRGSTLCPPSTALPFDNTQHYLPWTRPVMVLRSAG